MKVYPQLVLECGDSGFWEELDYTRSCNAKVDVVCSTVQLTFRNCGISSVYYQNFQCLVDFAKLRNQFSLLSEMSNVQLILRKF